MTPLDPDRLLATPRLVLEPIVPTHAPLLFGELQAASLYAYIPEDPPLTVEALARRYTAWARRRSPDGQEVWLNYALRHRQLGCWVGTVQATARTDGDAFIAYQVFPRHRRQGFAAEACRGLLAHLRSDPALSTAIAHLDTRNTASRLLVEALGFTRQRLIVQADTFKGSVSDEFVYTLERSRWLRSG